MIIDLKKEIYRVFSDEKTTPCKEYLEVIADMNTCFNSERVYNLNKDLFNNKRLLAEKFVIHAQYETMGGNLIKSFAEKFVKDELKEKLLLQSKDELKHGRMLLHLAKRITEENIMEKSLEDSNENIPDFKKDIRIFLCFVHVAEIKTLIMLLQYQKILEDGSNSFLKKIMHPTLKVLLKDERQHAGYTGCYLCQWISEDNAVLDLIKEAVTFFIKDEAQEMEKLKISIT